jgi:TIR domain
MGAGMGTTANRRLMPPVRVIKGNIFEGGADLTVLPSSAKGTISKLTRVNVDTHGLPTPLQIGPPVPLGQITGIVAYPGATTTTKSVAFAASVLDDATSIEAIENIAGMLGLLTNEVQSTSSFPLPADAATPMSTVKVDIKLVEVPLLGTGAGGLKTREAGAALARGFLSTAHPDATLHIFVIDQERFDILGDFIGEEIRRHKRETHGGIVRTELSHEVFISYHHRDLSDAEALAEDLRRHGVAVWYAPDLAGGQEFRKQIAAAIAQSKAVLGLFTAASVEAPWVIHETELAAKQQKLIPLRAPGLAVDRLPAPYASVLHVIPLLDLEAILSALRAKGVNTV